MVKNSNTFYIHMNTLHYDIDVYKYLMLTKSDTMSSGVSSQVASH